MTATILRSVPPQKAPDDHDTEHVEAAKPTHEQIAE
jgi:hypothetical protein